MKICASLSKEYSAEELEFADMAEIRLDIFKNIPKVNKELIITIRDVSDLDVIPKNFSGMMDIGSLSIQNENVTLVSSHHSDRTPDASAILEIFGKMSGDIVKGAFSVNDFKDLMNIYNASKIGKKHVIIGMNEIGAITRIRQKVLSNEFTFAHAGTPTASGQFSVSEMRRLGDDCIITGLVGHPLGSSSQRIHDSAFRNTGINGKYLMFDSSDVEYAGDVIRSYKIRGVNITIPFKTKIIEQLDSLDTVAKEVGAVNTVVNHDGELKGYNTDVFGISEAFDTAAVDVTGKRTLIIGSGGSARACAYYLKKKNSRTSITGRNLRTAEEISKEFGCTLVHQDSVALKMFDIIVNCTPLQNHAPVPLDHLDRSHIVFDLVHHSDTVLTRTAKEAGCTMVSGKDMLVAQAAESFRLWVGVSPDKDVMRNTL